MIQMLALLTAVGVWLGAWSATFPVDGLTEKNADNFRKLVQDYFKGSKEKGGERAEPCGKIS